MAGDAATAQPLSATLRRHRCSITKLTQPSAAWPPRLSRVRIIDLVVEAVARTEHHPPPLPMLGFFPPSPPSASASLRRQGIHRLIVQYGNVWWASDMEPGRTAFRGRDGSSVDATTWNCHAMQGKTLVDFSRS